MFSIAQMSSASEWYYLSIVNYYLGLESRKNLRRHIGAGHAVSAGGDSSSQADRLHTGDASPYTIDMPGEPLGKWGGSGAPILGILGIVHEDQYHRLFRGFHPKTGKALVQNAGKPNRRAGWEGCFTPPKCVSVLFSQMSPEDRSRLQEILWEAAEETIRFIEQNFAFSRAGKANDGCRYVPVKLVVPMFEHASARPTPQHLPDPNLHIHAQFLNIGIDQRTQETRAIDSAPIFANQKIITAFHNAKVAAALREEFGLVVHVTENGFRIQGVPRKLIKTYSKRRQQILEYLAEHGQAGGIDAAYAALKTRSRKDALISRKALFEHWQTINKAAGFDDKCVARLLRNRRRRPPQTASLNTPSQPAPIRTAAIPRIAAADTPPSSPWQSDSWDLPPQPAPARTGAAPRTAADHTPPAGPWQSDSWDLPPQPSTARADSGPETAADHTPSTSPQQSALPHPPPQPAAVNRNVVCQTTGSGIGRGTSTSRRSRKSRRAIRKVIREAVRGLTFLKNHFTQRDLAFSVLRILPEYAFDPVIAWEEIAAYLAKAPNIVPLGTAAGQCGNRYTTTQTLKDEERMLAGLARLSSRPGLRVSDRVLAQQLKKHPAIREDQVAFVRHLTQHNSAVRLGLGWAGSGKTFALKVFAAACKQAGFRVLCVAPTGQAAEVLSRETGIPCETVTKFLGDYRIPMLPALVYHLRQFWRAARGKRTWPIHKPKSAKITRRTIVLADESGMIGTPHMRELVERVEHGGGTLCLVGDPCQLPAISSTPPLTAIAQRHGSARLTTIRRQRKEWARKASEAFAVGDVGRALAMYAERNKVTVRDNIDEAVKEACLYWTAEGLLTPHRVVILANTNKLVHTANRLCQEHRLRAGVLGNSASIRITDEQDDEVYESRVYIEDRVLFTRNSRGRNGYGVNNGSVGTVKAISPFTPEIAVMLDDGRYVRVNVSKYRHIRLGYAGTPWKLQGSTRAKVLVILGGTGQNFPISYVQATRAVEDTQFYTTRDLLDHVDNVRRSPLVRQMSRKPDLTLASDFLPNAPLDHRPRKVRIRKTKVNKRPQHSSVAADTPNQQNNPVPPAPPPPLESPAERGSQPPQLRRVETLHRIQQLVRQLQQQATQHASDEAVREARQRLQRLLSQLSHLRDTEKRSRESTLPAPGEATHQALVRFVRAASGTREPAPSFPQPEELPAPHPPEPRHADEPVAPITTAWSQQQPTLRLPEASTPSSSSAAFTAQVTAAQSTPTSSSTPLLSPSPSPMAPRTRAVQHSACPVCGGFRCCNFGSVEFVTDQ